MRLSIAAAIILCWADASLAADAPRPNILLIFTDDQGTNDVGCYGSEIPTPHIDSLARDGLKLTQFYAASSICTPSRYGLFTGRFPTRSRDHLLGALMFLSEADAHRGIGPDEVMYPKLLQQSGYRTALVGKWHLGHGDKRFWPTRHGFDTFYGHTAGCIDFFTMKYGNVPDWYRDEALVETEGYATDLITDEAVRFLHEQKNADRPFYLHLAYNAPHYGKGWDPERQQPTNILQARPEDLQRVAAIEDPLRREYAAMVLALDDGIGRVLKALVETGLARDTLVIFMTDHGGDPDYGGSNLPFRGSKATLFEGGIRVPCLIRWPGRIKPGTQSNAVTTAWDIFPTLCRLAGAELPDAPLDGQDITPVFLEGQDPGEREFFWHTGRHAELARGQWTALRHGPWKYLQTPQGDEMLFDIEEDPHEKSDLAQSQPDRLQQMRSRRDQLLAECLPREQ